MCNQVLIRQKKVGIDSKRKTDLWFNAFTIWPIQFTHSDRIPLNQQRLSSPPVQLIGLILASVSLKAECICPTATPKGRKGNTSKPAAQLLADFKEIFRDYVPLRCLSPVRAKVTRVTLTVVLFMLLDFILLKPFGALLFAPHLLTSKTSINTEHTHRDSHTHMMKYLCTETCIKHKNIWLNRQIPSHIHKYMSMLINKCLHMLIYIQYIYTCEHDWFKD